MQGSTAWIHFGSLRRWRSNGERREGPTRAVATTGTEGCAGQRWIPNRMDLI